MESTGVSGEGEHHHCCPDHCSQDSFHTLLQSKILKVRYHPGGQLQGADAARGASIRIRIQARPPVLQAASFHSSRMVGSAVAGAVGDLQSTFLTPSCRWHMAPADAQD
jgi:hypothetical protein